MSLLFHFSLNCFFDSIVLFYNFFSYSGTIMLLSHNHICHKVFYNYSIFICVCEFITTSISSRWPMVSLLSALITFQVVLFILVTFNTSLEFFCYCQLLWNIFFLFIVNNLSEYYFFILIYHFRLLLLFSFHLEFLN